MRPAEVIDAVFGDTGWINLPLQSGFTSSNGGTNGDAPAQVRAWAGVAYLQGVVHGTFTAGSTFTVVAAGGIPVGMRPLHKLIRTSFQQAGGSARTAIGEDGSIVVTPSTTSTFIDLSAAGGYLIEA